MAQILICGIPGTGKTTVGEELATNHGFFHVDMEAGKGEAIRQLEDDETAFLGELATHENVVVTWGFKPYHYRKTVENMMGAGYKAFWFDGDRVAAFRHFMNREKHNDTDELNYYVQMQMVIATDIANVLDPVVIDPYDQAGEFRPTTEVTSEVLSHLG